MAGRTPAEAVQAFLAPLQQAIDCLTPMVLNVSGGYHVADRPPRADARRQRITHPWTVDLETFAQGSRLRERLTILDDATNNLPASTR